MSGRVSFIRRYGGYYTIVAAVVLGMKWYYSGAGCGELRWILAPTAWWVEVLSGNSFVYEPQIGYINHPLRFIIAPSCSGVQFLIIVFAVLAGAFIHRMKTGKQRVCWMAGCVVVSFLFTVLINGLRIAVSIYAPNLVFQSEWMEDLVTPSQLHTMIGATVYFGSLMAVYCAADCVVGRSEGAESDNTGWLVPVMIYGLIVLGLPLLNGALSGNGERYSGYAALVIVVCTLVLCLFWGVKRLWKIRRVWKIH